MKHKGFTLAELLIALVILGVIATFTIPKVLQTQQASSWKSSAKDVAGMLSGALQEARLNGTFSASTKVADLTPYMNYLSVDSTSQVDVVQTGNSVTCSGKLCLKLHNGGMLFTAFNAGTDTYCNTTSTNAVSFYFDPVSGDSGTTDTGKAVVFWLYANGMVRSYKTINAGTCYGTPACAISCANPNPGWEPTWFDWN